MGKWLERLHPPTKPTCKTVKSPSDGFAGSLDGRIQDGMAISQAIGLARDWQDLSRIWPRIDEAFKEGELTPEQADPLISAVINRSRELPVVAGYRPSASGRGTAPPLALATFVPKDGTPQNTSTEEQKP